MTYSGDTASDQQKDDLSDLDQIDWSAPDPARPLSAAEIEEICKDLDSLAVSLPDDDPPLEVPKTPTDAPSAAPAPIPAATAQPAVRPAVLEHIAAHYRKSGRRFIDPHDPLANEKRAVENYMQRNGESYLGEWRGQTLDDVPEGFWAVDREERNAWAQCFLYNDSIRDSDRLRGNIRRKARAEKRRSQGYPADYEQHPVDERKRIAARIRKARSRANAKSVTATPKA